MFDQSTANRFLRKCHKWHINQLERVLHVMIQAHGRFAGIVRCEADFDASDLTSSSHKREGAKPGRNKKQKGKDSSLISCGFAHHQIVATDLRSGNAHCSQVLDTLFAKALKTLRRIDLVRLDAGYISVNTLTWLLTQTISATSRAYLRVRGHWMKQIFKRSIDPCKPYMKQVIEPIFTPSHAHTFKTLLDKPFTRTFDHATANG